MLKVPFSYERDAVSQRPTNKAAEQAAPLPLCVCRSAGDTRDARWISLISLTMKA